MSRRFDQPPLKSSSSSSKPASNARGFAGVPLQPSSSPSRCATSFAAGPNTPQRAFYTFPLPPDRITTHHPPPHSPIQLLPYHPELILQWTKSKRFVYLVVFERHGTVDLTGLITLHTLPLDPDDLELVSRPQNTLIFHTTNQLRSETRFAKSRSGSRS